MKGSDVSVVATAAVMDAFDQLVYVRQALLAGRISAATAVEMLRFVGDSCHNMLTCAGIPSDPTPDTPPFSDRLDGQS